jgi:tetratricopeptide (TPR) repeat protein
MSGYAATEVEAVFARAHTLCQSLGDIDKLYSALTGLHSFYQVRGSLPQAVDAGHRLVDIAESRGDTLWRAQSHRCLGWSLFCSGQGTAGAEHLYIALGLFDRLRAREHARLHGAHPWVVGFVNCAYLECFAGRPEVAVERSRDALALARELGQPLALAYALCMSAAVYCERREPATTLAMADEAIELALRHDMPYWSSWGNTLRGWALVHQGQHHTGLAVLNAGLDSYRATGALLFEASSLALLAQSYSTMGDHQRALEVIELSLANPLLPDGYFYTPELHRLHSTLLLANGDDGARALGAAEQALALARAQGAGGLERRAREQLQTMAAAAA